jgi:hypothetical protein
MKYAVEMGSGATIFIPCFIKIGSSNQKLIGGGGLQTQHGDLISLLLFFQNKESKLKMVADRIKTVRKEGWKDLKTPSVSLISAVK